MSGETHLSTLLSTLSPQLLEDESVFCTFASAVYGDQAALAPVASVMESEGLTLVVPRQKADAHGICYESVFRGITLTVHSSLDAIGLTAAFSAKLTEQGISANVIAGFYHDHVFVQSEEADRAMSALKQLSD